MINNKYTQLSLGNGHRRDVRSVMPLLILTDFRWYIIISILTFVCVVNLILAVYVTLGLCDEFIVKCREGDVVQSPLYWTIVSIALITFVILILLLCYVIQMRKVWEAQRIKIKQEFELRKLRKEIQRDAGNNNQPSHNQQFGSSNDANQSNC